MKLSIVIPARNEEFLQRTVEDILENIEGDTEILVGLDGYWANPPIKDHPKVTILHHTESVGQRAITNDLVNLSRAKYIMKVDAHCSFDKGFDVKMMNLMEDDITMIPTMRNLWAFDWKCYDCGKRTYQGITPEKCTDCGGTNIKKKIVWEGKSNPQSTAYRFDKELHFQYWNEYGKPLKGDLTPTLSAQGSCFMITRWRYRKLNICDEAHGSWGQQGTEVALKTWLSGGRLLVNRTTWYAHMFRTKGGDFGFPYPNGGIKAARKYSQDLWLNNKWDKQIMTLEELLNKFKPVPDWHEG